MAFYIVTRNDHVDAEQYDALIVRARGRKQALDLVTDNGSPFDGFKADGSNATVTKLEDSREHDNAVLLASYIAG
jgi:hypothetical protein